jgi:hypothetical protein
LPILRMSKSEETMAIMPAVGASQNTIGELNVNEVNDCKVMNMLTCQAKNRCPYRLHIFLRVLSNVLVEPAISMNLNIILSVPIWLHF